MKMRGSSQERKKQKEDKTREDHVRISSTSWWHANYRHVLLPIGLVPCFLYYTVGHLFPTFVHRSSYLPLLFPLVLFSATPLVAPPPPIPLDTTHGGCVALPSQPSLSLVPPHHEPFVCFKDPPVSLPRLFGCSGPQHGLNSKHQGGKFRFTLRWLGTPRGLRL